MIGLLSQVVISAGLVATVVVLWWRMDGWRRESRAWKAAYRLEVAARAALEVKRGQG